MATKTFSPRTNVSICTIGVSYDNATDYYEYRIYPSWYEYIKFFDMYRLNDLFVNWVVIMISSFFLYKYDLKVVFKIIKDEKRIKYKW